VKVGGNIGTPALSLLEDDVELYVLELSSFQLESTKNLQAKTGTVLNVGPDHLDRYPSFEVYRKVKQTLFNMCQTPVFDREKQKLFQEISFPKNSVSFGLDKAPDQHFGLAKASEKIYFTFGNQALLSVDEIKLRGEHQWRNILASLALGYVAGFSISSMVKTIKRFSSLPHRCEWVGNYKGVDWYNDSKATNIGSAIAAIEGMGKTVEGRLFWIGGGLGKGADFSSLRPTVLEYVDTAFLLGKDGRKIAQALKDACTLQYVNDFYQAVELIDQKAEPGDLVIFSPACASFDMFESFEKRGEAFVRAVQLLYSD
jgi:UDP-N-acetylmuramoylalanine--D-glutamate ligase